jgi:hypothetical protein
MSERKQGANGGFFGIDARIWPKVCSLGMNEAVAYLVLARGTGPDNRTTAWSVEAIERYTGVSRGRAKAAVKRLQDEGLIGSLRSGSNPKYDLIPFGELPGADPRPPLTFSEKCVLDRVQRGLALSRKDREHARSAVKKEWLFEHEGQFAIRPAPEIKPELIWLPNELVTGAAGETPPLELVRQTQDPMTLRLLIDLYHAQNLREDGGISRQIIYGKYERTQLGQQAQFVVWGFKHQGGEAWDRWPISPHKYEPTEEEKKAGSGWGVDFWKRWGCLVGLGLIDWVPHLVESGERSGEIIHPLGLGASDSIEDRLGTAAQAAATALLTEFQRGMAISDYIECLVPVARHMADVQLVGIARLRYRPHTRMTAAWWAELNEQAEKHLARYDTITRERTRAAV